MEHVDPLRNCRPVRVDDLERSPAKPRQGFPTVLAYDTYRRGDELVIEFDVPGVDPSAVELAVEGRDLTVTVSRGLAQGRGIDVIDAGRSHGRFTERLLLGSKWDLSGIRARVENGVLSVRAPLANGCRRLIPVELGSARPSQNGHDGARTLPEQDTPEPETVPSAVAVDERAFTAA